MRNSYNKKLEKLKDSLTKMCYLCDDSISSSMNVLHNPNDSIIIGQCGEISKIKDELEEQCINLLLEENPVATDFRVIIATLLMIADLSRIGAQSSRISELAKIFRQHGISLDDTKLDDLSQIAIDMVRNSIQAVINNDVALAESVIRGDDDVDTAFQVVKQKIATLIIKQPESGDLLIDLMLVGKYYERIGDHSVNIAKLVKYRLNGKDA